MDVQGRSALRYENSSGHDILPIPVGWERWALTEGQVLLLVTTAIVVAGFAYVEKRPFRTAAGGTLLHSYVSSPFVPLQLILQE